MASPQDTQKIAWHTRESGEVVSDLDTDVERGLSGEEARRRLEQYGRNEIPVAETMPWYRILLRQFADPLIYILLIAAVISLVFQEYVDAVIILVVVAINGTIGFVQETKAHRAIRSLSKMSAPKARVVRGGQRYEIASEEVVPGDIVLLGSGARVPADIRLLSVRDLEVDESALTGESAPVAKRIEAVKDEKAVPGDQFCMTFSGTNVTRGRGRGVVVRTGDATMLGRIAEATQQMQEIETPLQESMHWLGKAIGAATVVLCLVVVIGGMLTGWELREIMRTAVALAVGAVPEALPIVVTVTLAVGVQRMARRNAIIRLLPSVETLGQTTVVGSDKTGTLTTNQMTVQVIWSAGRRYRVSGNGYKPEGEIKPFDDEEVGGQQRNLGEAVRMTLLAGLLANESENLPDEEGRSGGDPTELALLVSAIKGGYDLGQTRQEYEQLDTIPFESERQFMATLNRTPDGRCTFLKGAPEAVLRHCSKQLGADGEEELDKDAARHVADELAKEGYRVLGMALRHEEDEQFDGDDPGDDLVFVGFQGMEDPVRPEAVEAVQAAQEAGIRVLMLTGDHVKTARAIGDELGLDGDGRAEEGRSLDDRSDEELDEIVRKVNVYARVSPEHKLKLVERLKAQGHIVAVTGDGVNDAPALHAAHLGVAMGKSGTDVAREASDMVLADDNFATITNAIEEGRIVFANIRKVTYFLLSTGVGLVITILSALFGPWPLPYVAAQVLWINLVTNGLQDVALAFEPGEPGLLRDPPRDPREGVINRAILYRIVMVGIYIAAATMAVFWWILQQDVSMELARSVAITQMVLFQFFHVFNCRSLHRSLLDVNFFGNRFVLGAVILALLVHFAFLYVPSMQKVFETEPIPLAWWGVIIAVAATILLVAELDKVWLRRRMRRQTGQETK